MCQVSASHKMDVGSKLVLMSWVRWSKRQRIADTGAGVNLRTNEIAALTLLDHFTHSLCPSLPSSIMFAKSQILFPLGRSLLVWGGEPENCVGSCCAAGLQIPVSDVRGQST